MEAARVQPDGTGFLNAIQVYPFTEGALYQIYAKPGQVTDIALQEGEQLVGSGPVASGDTVRWMIGDTVNHVRQWRGLGQIDLQTAHPLVQRALQPRITVVIVRVQQIMQGFA